MASRFSRASRRGARGERVVDTTRFYDLAHHCASYCSDAFQTAAETSSAARSETMADDPVADERCAVKMVRRGAPGGVTSRHVVGRPAHTSCGMKATALPVSISLIWVCRSAVS